MRPDSGFFYRGGLFASNRWTFGHGGHLDSGDIERVYRRYARFYDLCFGAIFQPGRKAIVESMACAPGDRILEVGVGTGLSLPLYPKDVEVTGIDISRDMLAQAEARRKREKLDNVVELAVMDAEGMTFEDNSFDRVVAMHVASVAPHPELLVAEMRRVCKPNGHLFFVNHSHSRNPVMGGVESLLAPMSRQLGFRPDFSLEHFLDETGLVAMHARRVDLFG
ncbi:MAG TPA: methyltransferase domain-containing protein, partial [Gallionella sp.]|nr:methyltransferase domain-containing protein [Gallionella sp.]